MSIGVIASYCSQKQNEIYHVVIIQRYPDTQPYWCSGVHRCRAMVELEAWNVIYILMRRSIFLQCVVTIMYANFANKPLDRVYKFIKCRLLFGDKGEKSNLYFYNCDVLYISVYICKENIRLPWGVWWKKRRCCFFKPRSCTWSWDPPYRRIGLDYLGLFASGAVILHPHVWVILRNASQTSLRPFHNPTSTLSTERVLSVANLFGPWNRLNLILWHRF